MFADLIAVARGVVPLPKSVTNSRIEENLKILSLDSEDLDALNKIHKTKGVTRFVYPPFGVCLTRGMTDHDSSTDIPQVCLLYTSPSPRDGLLSRMPSSA